MDFITIVENLLLQKGVTAAKMSRDLGFSNAVYYQWKAGKQNPSTDKLEKMANYFGVSVEYLMGKEQKESAPITRDAAVSEIIDIMEKLSPELKDIALNQLRSLAEHAKKKENE